MDYAFAPGASRPEGYLRNLFKRRTPATTLVHRRNLSTVHGFIDHLASSSSITLPIGNILLGSHANSQGLLKLKLFPNQKKVTGKELTDYETLEATLGDPARSIDIPTTITQDFVHIRGCNIGKATPFLTKMRAVMGGQVSITAPLHFDELYDNSLYGTWEYMAYEFVVRNPADFATRADVIAAFQNASPAFRLIHGTPVPPGEWDKWIPGKVKAGSKVKLHPQLGHTMGKRSTVDAYGEFRVERTTFTWSIKYPTASDVPPPAQQEQAIRTSIQQGPTFQATHPYPTWVRYGYSTVNDFFAGHTWKYSKKGRTLLARGTRTTYTVVRPIEVSGNLVVNFFPIAGKGYLPIIELNENDSLFFGKVP